MMEFGGTACLWGISLAFDNWKRAKEKKEKWGRIDAVMKRWKSICDLRASTGFTMMTLDTRHSRSPNFASDLGKDEAKRAIAF